MTSRRVLSGASLVLVFAGACGSDSNAPSSSDGGHSGTPPSVPAYIDLDVCAHILETMSGSFSGECSACCRTAGFQDSSSINDDKCTCGNMPDSGGDTVCASQSSTSDACGTCCDDAGYSINFWIGGNSCRCNGKNNDTVCTSAVSDSNVCAHCCLGNGFLGFGFVGIGGSPTCSCHGK